MICDCGSVATHTVIDERNTFTYLCPAHAGELMREYDYDEDLTGLVLLSGVEETDTERKRRWQSMNLLG